MLTTPDHADALTSPPAFAPVGPKPRGFWQDCDPSTGAEGTTFRAEEFNEAALNLRALVDAAGLVAVKGAPTTLRAALHRLYAGDGRVVTASLTLTPDDAGLVIVDAAAADVTLTLPSAAALPDGELTYYAARADASTHTVRIVAAAGESIRGGALWLDDSVILRSDGATQWFPFPRTPPIRHTLTLNVAPGGAAEPADPIGGAPFNRIESALAWLNGREIIGSAVVTIAVAAATYAYTASLNVTHPQGSQIEIVGAGSGTTILTFAACMGFYAATGCRRLKGVTLRGNDAGATDAHGILVATGTYIAVDDVIVEHFAGNGVRVLPGALLAVDTVLTTQDHAAGAGLYVWMGGTVTGNRINANRCATTAGISNIEVTRGQLACDAIYTVAGKRGLVVEGAGASAQIRLISVTDCTIPTESVNAYNGGVLLATSASAPSDWTSWHFTSGSQTFRATDYGFIQAFNAMNPSNKPTTSPAINTLGNTQAYIKTT